MDDAGEGDNKNRDVNDCQARTGGDITRHRALVAPISCVLRLERRQSHPAVVSWSDHERWTLFDVRTEKQQVVSLSTADSELYAAVEGMEIQSVAKDQGIVCVLSLHLDATGTLSPVNRRGLGKAKHVHMRNLCGTLARVLEGISMSFKSPVKLKRALTCRAVELAMRADRVQLRTAEQAVFLDPRGRVQQQTVEQVEDVLGVGERMSRRSGSPRVNK